MPVPRTPRVALVGVFHETNTFSPVVTDLAAFELRGLMTGPAWIDAFAGTRTVGGGFVAGCEEQEMEPVGVFGAYATPSGTITEETVDVLLARLEAALRATPDVDAVLLELHGALVAEGHDDAEQEIVDLILAAYGSQIPLACVVDLHANVGTDRLRGPQALIGYRTNPHVDTFDRGVQAAWAVRSMLDGDARPVRVHRSIPAAAIPSMQATADEPLRSIVATARELQDRHGFLEVTVHAGYAYADVPHLGMGFTVTTDEAMRAEAEEAAAALAAFAAARTAEFAADLPAPAEAIATALDGAPEGLAVIADSGDNINGGSPGDGTWLLHALRDTAPGVRALATVWDPESYRGACAVGEGATFRARLGGQTGAASGAPFEADVEVISVGTGTFTNTGPMATGAVVTMNGAALVRAGLIDIVIQNRPLQPNDPELFRCMGVDPVDYRLACLKGATAVRAGWAPLTSTFVQAGTPGACDSRLDRLEYRNADVPELSR